VAGPGGWWRRAAWTSAGAWAVAGVAVATKRAGWGSAATGWAAAGTAAAVSASLAWGAWRLGRNLTRLERTARELARGNTPATGVRVAQGSRGDGGKGSDELAGLRRALDDLRRRIEEQLKEVARKSRNLEALIDGMDEPVLATDSADAVLLCNRSAEAMFGGEAGPRAEGPAAIRAGRGLIGRTVSELFTQAELLAMHAAAKSGQTRRGRVRVTTSLGVRTFQVSASPVPAAWGAGVFGAVMVLRDVTELDQAVQVKTDFVANASHELRTPVAAIRGAAETLESGGLEDPEMAGRLVRMINEHAARLEEMLRDLLDLSRLETPDVPMNIAPVDVAALARMLRELFEEDCRARSLGLEFRLDEHLAGLRTDAQLVTVILRNLVENATKYAYEGTTIRVTGTLVEEAVGRSRGVARFEVADKGIGIPLNQQDRVFERYYQVDPARTGVVGRRGTGLGLAIVKHAARALGGRVGLHSVWGEGTTVWVEIPVVLGPDGEAPAGDAGDGGDRPSALT
jgi:two-component system phosphate regulon sensor histidine kinase PhoR